MRKQKMKIPNFGGYYISCDGTVTSTNRGSKERVLKHQRGTNGYLHVHCIDDTGRRRIRLIHRMVAEAYIPNPLSLRYVNHKNGVKTDYRIENLEWCTHSENVKHAFTDLGRKMKRGSSAPTARFSQEEVIDIKRRIDIGEGITAISRVYSCPPSTIDNIKRGTRYN